MDLAFTRPERALPAPLAAGRAGDRYLAAFGACLLGYALMGRAFAYLGVPPLFIGEAMLAAGLAVAVRWRGVGQVAAVGPFWILLALQGLTVVRSVPYLGTYGLDVARDSMLFGYGLYAYVVFILLVDRPERLRELVLKYRTFAVVMVALVWLPYLAYRVNETWIPFMPGQTNVRMIEAKGGDLMVHLSGIAAFLVLGLRRNSWPVTLALAVTAVLVMVSNRGGMIAFVLALGLAALLKPPGASGLRLGFALVAVVVAGIVAVPVMEAVRISGDSRALTVEQIWDNVKSVVGQSDSHSLETTKAWRLAWWGKIADETLLGPRRWDGHGFGLNLANRYGFEIDDRGSLRSPHNATMTVLARTGVPGLALWLALHAAFVFWMLRAWFAARAARLYTWSAVFAFALCLWVAVMVNASFEVYVEGPMGGIWLWTVFGAGLAAARIARTHPDLFATPDFDAAVRVPRVASAAPGPSAPRTSEAGAVPDALRRPPAVTAGTRRVAFPWETPAPRVETPRVGTPTAGTPRVETPRAAAWHAE